MPGASAPQETEASDTRTGAPIWKRQGCGRAVRFVLLLTLGRCDLGWRREGDDPPERLLQEAWGP